VLRRFLWAFTARLTRATVNPYLYWGPVRRCAPGELSEMN